MSQSEDSSLLDREGMERQAQVAFSTELSLLKSVVDFGDGLIMRAFNASDQTLPDVITCLVLLKQVVRMLDAVHIQVNAGSAPPGFTLVRAALEASLYLEWILSEATEERAMLYYVGDVRERRIWAERALYDGAALGYREPSEDLRAAVSSISPEAKGEFEAQIVEIDRILAQPGLSEFNQQFESWRARNKKALDEPSWYQIAGVGTIAGIAKALDRMGDYLAFYGKGSAVAHAQSYRDHVSLGRGGKVSIKSIRDPRETVEVVRNAVAVALPCYAGIIERYVPDDLGAFRVKYTLDWRERNLAMSGH